MENSSKETLPNPFEEYKKGTSRHDESNKEIIKENDKDKEEEMEKEKPTLFQKCNIF